MILCTVQIFNGAGRYLTNTAMFSCFFCKHDSKLRRSGDLTTFFDHVNVKHRDKTQLTAPLMTRLRDVMNKQFATAKQARDFNKSHPFLPSSDLLELLVAPISIYSPYFFDPVRVHGKCESVDDLNGTMLGPHLRNNFYGAKGLNLFYVPVYYRIGRSSFLCRIVSHATSHEGQSLQEEKAWRRSVAEGGDFLCICEENSE